MKTWLITGASRVLSHPCEDRASRLTSRVTVANPTLTGIPHMSTPSMLSRARIEHLTWGIGNN